MIDHNAEVLRLLELEERLTKRTKIDSYYPDTGPLRRERCGEEQFGSLGRASSV